MPIPAITLAAGRTLTTTALAVADEAALAGPSTTGGPGPARILFGAGRAGDLATVCRDLGLRHPLLLTDATLARTATLGDLLAGVTAAGLRAGLYSGARANPTDNDVAIGVTAFRQGRHDGIVAVGGGGVLDLGKAVALAAVEGEALSPFERYAANDRSDTTRLPPVVALPTTAGAGAEATAAAVILDPQTGRKRSLYHPRMLPSAAIVDPRLTLDLPPHLTTAGGLDVLARCLEGYCRGDGRSPVAREAVEDLRLVRAWLPRAYARGDDLAARSALLSASLKGAMAFVDGPGAIHAVAAPVSAAYDAHQGLVTAILLPHLLRARRLAVEARLTALAQALELEAPTFEGLVGWIEDLRRAVGIPGSLRAVGVRACALGRLSRDAEPMGGPLALDRPARRQLYETALTAAR